MNDFKFPSIKGMYDGNTIINPNLYVYEKIDGGNVSIRKQQGKVVPWSRGGPLGRSDKYYFPAFRHFVFELLAPEVYQLPENLVIFGEFPHPGYGHLSYNLENLNHFFLIGVYDSEAGRFLQPEQAREKLTGLGLMGRIRPTPLLGRGSLSKAKANRLLRQSCLYHGPPEGLVLHLYHPALPQGLQMQKYYHPQFREIDPGKEGVERYATFRRLVKAGQRVLAEGKAGSKREEKTERNSEGKPEVKRIELEVKRREQGISLEALIEAAADDIVSESGIPEREVLSALLAKGEFIRQRVLPLFE